MTDHTRFGYYCSLALHITVTVAAIISVLMKSIFKTDDHLIDPQQVFEMVEPAPEMPVAQESQPTDAMPQLEHQKEIAAIEPMELPEPEPTPPEPTPEPTPPESKPEPAPKPSPKPKLKKVAKPAPPKKVSFSEFVKNNPKANRNPAPSRPRTSAPVKVGKISAGTGNLDKLAAAKISVKGGTGAAMRSLLDLYIIEIRRKAHSNWAIPTMAQGVDYTAEVQFRVSQNGAISGLRIIKSSGNPEFDNSILSAMRSVSLTPPPDNDPHTVTITFSTSN